MYDINSPKGELNSQHYDKYNLKKNFMKLKLISYMWRLLQVTIQVKLGCHSIKYSNHIIHYRHVIKHF